MPVADYIDEAAVAAAKEVLECGHSATYEIVEMVAALDTLAVSTADFARELAADGFVLRAEEAQQRSILYSMTRDAILRIWNPDYDLKLDDAKP